MTDVLVLEPRLDLAAATPLMEALSARLGQNVTLDASQVTQFGALCLQVVMAAGQAFAKTGHTLSLSGASDAVVAQLAHMGVSPETIMGDPE